MSQSTGSDCGKHSSVFKVCPSVDFNDLGQESGLRGQLCAAFMRLRYAARASRWGLRKTLRSLFLLWPILAIALAREWGKIRDAPLVVKACQARESASKCIFVPFRPPHHSGPLGFLN